MAPGSRGFLAGRPSVCSDPIILSGEDVIARRCGPPRPAPPRSWCHHLGTPPRNDVTASLGKASRFPPRPARVEFRS